MIEASKLFKTFTIGVSDGSSFVKEYQLLRSNGIAERVFLDKLPQKPYTWMGNVLSVAIAAIGDHKIGASVRQEFARSESVTIPEIIKQIPYADANTALVEVHRTVWKNLVKQQDSVCKFCGNDFKLDIDLNRLDFTPEQKLKLAEKDDWTRIELQLPAGYEFNGLQAMGGQELYDEFKGITFDKFTFRVPTLGDAIRHERFYADSVMFWRYIAFDCLESITATGSMAELPVKVLHILGMKLFNEELFSEDLEAIRNALREHVPSMPLWYEEECPTPTCRRQTPVTMEASSFFSE